MIHKRYDELWCHHKVQDTRRRVSSSSPTHVGSVHIKISNQPQWFHFFFKWSWKYRTCFMSKNSHFLVIASTALRHAWNNWLSTNTRKNTWKTKIYFLIECRLLPTPKPILLWQSASNMFWQVMGRIIIVCSWHLTYTYRNNSNT